MCPHIKGDREARADFVSHERVLFALGKRQSAGLPSREPYTVSDLNGAQRSRSRFVGFAERSQSVPEVGPDLTYLPLARTEACQESARG